MIKLSTNLNLKNCVMEEKNTLKQILNETKNKLRIKSNIENLICEKVYL